MNKKPKSYNEQFRKILFFSSHEEQASYELNKMAAQSFSKNLELLEQMRLFFLRQFLLPDGTWKPIEREITITKNLDTLK